MHTPLPQNRGENSLPQSAYHWELLDSSAKHSTGMTAVYRHRTNKAWLAIRPDNMTSTQKARIFSPTKPNQQTLTDAECLIGLLASEFNSELKPIQLGEPQRGAVGDAYTFTESKLDQEQ